MRGCHQKQGFKNKINLEGTTTLTKGEKGFE